jgi:hypothetical protein
LPGNRSPDRKVRGAECIQCSAGGKPGRTEQVGCVQKGSARRGANKNPSQRPVAKWIRPQKGVRETARVSVRPRAWPLARFEGDVIFAAVLPNLLLLPRWVKLLLGSLFFRPPWAASFLPSAVSVLRRAISNRSGLKKSVTGVAFERDARYLNHSGNPMFRLRSEFADGRGENLGVAINVGSSSGGGH